MGTGGRQQYETVKPTATIAAQCLPAVDGWMNWTDEWVSE